MDNFSKLPPGSILSYSAGSSDLNPEKFRLITESKEDRLLNIIKIFPHLYPFLDQPSIIISCYPASIGFFSNAIFVDTYLKWENFSRALLLAQQRNFSVIIIGQPLPTLHLLYKHKKLLLPFPKKIVIGIGGYYCPLSLEIALLETIDTQTSKSSIIHAYGMAEAEFSCLAGCERNVHEDIIYQPILNHIQPILKARELILRKSSPDQNHFLDFPTGDFAEMQGTSLTITNSFDRLDPAIALQFKNWNLKDWERKTGYLTKQKNQLFFQLREGENKLKQNEIEFHEFSRKFSFSWSNKPNWGTFGVTE